MADVDMAAPVSPGAASMGAESMLEKEIGSGMEGSGQVSQELQVKPEVKQEDVKMEAAASKKDDLGKH